MAVRRATPLDSAQSESGRSTVLAHENCLSIGINLRWRGKDFCLILDGFEKISAAISAAGKSGSHLPLFSKLSNFGQKIFPSRDSLCLI
jgi:hypothetical protein